MAGEISGNVMIVQLAKKKAVVMNGCLSSLITEVLNFDCVEEVYGARNGISGLIEGHVVDLASKSQKIIKNLVYTPGAALGSSIKDVSDEENRRIFNVLKEKDVKFLFILGDEASFNVVSQINDYSEKNNEKIRIMFIPFSNGNILPLTDHCLGYGSFAKQLAATVRSIVSENDCATKMGCVSVIEVSGCENDWMIASGALARTRFDSNLPPHVTVIPSKKIENDLLLQLVKDTVVQNGNCVILTSKKTASNDNSGEYIKNLILNSFDIEVELIRTDFIENSGLKIISKTDLEEACECAKRAANMMISFGVTGKMVTLLRADSIKYTSEVTCVEIATVLGKTKDFPENWYEDEIMQIGLQYFKYATPLIAGEVETIFDAGLPLYSEI